MKFNNTLKISIFNSIELEYKTINLLKQLLLFAKFLRASRILLLKLIKAKKKNIELLQKLNLVLETEICVITEKSKELDVFSNLENIIKFINNNSIQKFDDIIKILLAEKKEILKFYNSINTEVSVNNEFAEILEKLIKSTQFQKNKISEFVLLYKSEREKIDQQKNIIIFDLDGTIVNNDIQSYSNPKSILLRPNAREILEKLSKKYILCIFSKSTIDYIKYTIEHCKLDDLFFFYFDYTFTTNNSVKDLTHLIKRIHLPNYMIYKMIILDDSFKIKPENNFIKVPVFTGEKRDNFFNENLIKTIAEKFEKLNANLWKN